MTNLMACMVTEVSAILVATITFLQPLKLRTMSFISYTWSTNLRMEDHAPMSYIYLNHIWKNFWHIFKKQTLGVGLKTLSWACEGRAAYKGQTIKGAMFSSVERVMSLIVLTADSISSCPVRNISTSLLERDTQIVQSVTLWIIFNVSDS